MGNKNLPVTNEAAIGGYLNEVKIRLPEYAVRKYKFPEFIKTAMLAIIENENLQRCLETPQGKQSLKNALRQAAVTGLSLNPAEGQACLVAYGNKVTYQTMKDGIITLAMESGKVEMIVSDLIHVGDKFTPKKTSRGDEFEHIPAISKRGEVEAYYVCVLLKNGRNILKVWDKAKGEEHRNKYAKGLKDREGNTNTGHSWIKSFDGMVIKSIIKEIFRTTFISPDVKAAVVVDDIAENHQDIKDITSETESLSADDLKKTIENVSVSVPVEPTPAAGASKPSDAF